MLWLTADQHLGHANIIGHCSRPYATADDMNRDIIARHNAVVSEGDVVVHVGDFAWNPQLVRFYLAQMRGTHHLVSGNHDRCHPCHSRHARERSRYVKAGFASVHERLEFDCGSMRVLVCHFPSYTPYGTIDSRAGLVRYPDYRPRPETFDVLIHGHVHNARPTVVGSEVNVGVDVRGFSPVPCAVVASDACLCPAALEAALLAQLG